MTTKATKELMDLLNTKRTVTTKPPFIRELTAKEFFVTWEYLNFKWDHPAISEMIEKNEEKEIE